MNIKKIGLTALAGSLVATSAFAGEMSIAGGAKFSYMSDEAGSVASPYAMDQELTATGSAELDNGMTVSVTHALGTGGSGSSTSSLSLNMGDMGTLTYSDTDISGGLKALDDITPTAYEEVTNGITGAVQAAAGNGAGFTWGTSIGGAAVSVMYSDNVNATTARSDGSDDNTAASASSTSAIGVTYPVADTGLTVYGGVGTEGQADSTEIDHTTIGVKYAYGPVTVGYQVNDEDNSAADNTVAADEYLETTIMGVSFMVNDNLSISYGEHTTTSTVTSAPDQEIEGVSVSYSMGGITISAYDNEGTAISNVAGSNVDSQEILVSFAF